MSNLIEPLEGRTLFAAAPIPTNVAAAYTTVVADQQTLRTDAATTTVALHSAASGLDSDVSAVGITKTNLVLGRKVLAAGTKYLAVLNTDTRVFTARLTPVLRNLESAESAYVAKQTNATFKRLTAADHRAGSVNTLALKLQTAIGNTGAVDASLTALADANSSSTALNADVQRTIAATGTLATTSEAHVSTLLTDLNTFMDAVPTAS